MFLASYGKFEPVVYDTQGINDDGSDLVLRCRPENSDGDPELICFQVKSYDDLLKKTYMQELKAQRDDSFRKVIGLRHYFLILCTDESLHRKKLRNIMAEFRSADRTEVIEPAFAYTFLHHPNTRVDALVKRAMEAEDYVFNLALGSLEFPNPSARALALFLVVRFVLSGQSTFQIEDLRHESGLQNIYGELRSQQQALLELYESAEQGFVPPFEDQDEAPDDAEGEDMREYSHETDDTPIQIADFDEQLAADLLLLENDVLEVGSASSHVTLRPEELRALVAVVSDSVARYEYDEEQLLTYMSNVMGVLS
ncbi:MAG: hypothetical protein ACJ79K_06045 [Gemmatimonadaceae bacterium]